MDAEVLKSFLVGLGFGVDDASLAKFNKAIVSASAKVAALYGGIQIAAAGIFASISEMSAGFEDIGYQLRLVAPAINKMLILRQAMISAYHAAGINLTKAVQQSILFNYSLAKTKFALEAVYKSVGLKFLPFLTKQMDLFRARIFNYMPKIQEQLTHFVELVFKGFSITVQFGTRIWEILGIVYDALKRLDTATNGWSTRVLVFIGVWKALNLSFLLTPFGLVLAGLVAIIALYDDFKVWKQGGKTAFNWTSFVPVIRAVGDVLGDVRDILGSIFRVLFGVVGLFSDLFHFNFAGFKEDFKNMLGDVGDAATQTSKYFKDMFNLGGAEINWAKSVDEWALQHLGLATNAAAVNTTSVVKPQPLVSSQSNSSQVQNINMQTTANITGVTDANAAARAIRGVQSDSAFDISRNMKGALRQ